MDKKNRFHITLAGKTYTLTGQESNEYLKCVSDYIENKYSEYSSNLTFRTQPMDMQHIILQVNIADDYFKCREQLAIQTRKLEEQAAKVQELQSSLVSMQVKYENLEAGAKLTQKKYQEAKARISQLENLQKNETN